MNNRCSSVFTKIQKYQLVGFLLSNGSACSAWGFYVAAGLLINFVHHYWPSLLKIDGFLQEFITPIVKVSKGKLSVCVFVFAARGAGLDRVVCNISALC